MTQLDQSLLRPNIFIWKHFNRNIDMHIKNDVVQRPRKVRLRINALLARKEVPKSMAHASMATSWSALTFSLPCEGIAQCLKTWEGAAPLLPTWSMVRQLPSLLSVLRTHQFMHNQTKIHPTNKKKRKSQIVNNYFLYHRLYWNHV